MKKWIIAGLLIFGIQSAKAQGDPAVLVIGASFANGKVPFNSGLTSPFFGVSVNGGSYLSLGDALVRNQRLPGFVINEAQAGATTLERLGCNPGPNCGPGQWDSYSVQLQRALARVADPLNPGSFNAEFVVISSGNDCLHSDAFGVPQDQTSACTDAQLNEVVDRLLAVGQQVLAVGLTPIYEVYPKYEDMDLPLAQSLFGFHWVMDEVTFNKLRDLVKTRIPAEQPDALLVNLWKRFTHLGDGIHPTPDTAKRAARRVIRAMDLFKANKK